MQPMRENPTGLRRGSVKKEQKISAIKEGTVIDHIPVQYTWKIAEMLDVVQMRNIVSVSTNLESKKMGKKGLIKIGGAVLSEKVIHKISILAPGATLSVIKDYKVMQKTKLTVPYEIIDVVRCFNPNCITNKDKAQRRFTLINRSQMMLRCNYCERVMTKDEIRVL